MACCFFTNVSTAEVTQSHLSLLSFIIIVPHGYHSILLIFHLIIILRSLSRGLSYISITFYFIHHHAHATNILILVQTSSHSFTLSSLNQVGIMQRCGKFNRLVEVLSFPITTSFPLFLFVVCYDHNCLLLTFLYTVLYLTRNTYNSRVVHVIFFPTKLWLGSFRYVFKRSSKSPSHF